MPLYSWEPAEGRLGQEVIGLSMEQLSGLCREEGYSFLVNDGVNLGDVRRKLQEIPESSGDVFRREAKCFRGSQAWVVPWERGVFGAMHGEG